MEEGGPLGRPVGPAVEHHRLTEKKRSEERRQHTSRALSNTMWKNLQERGTVNGSSTGDECVSIENIGDDLVVGHTLIGEASHCRNLPKHHAK